MDEKFIDSLSEFQLEKATNVIQGELDALAEDFPQKPFSNHYFLEYLKAKQPKYVMKFWKKYLADPNNAYAVDSSNTNYLFDKLKPSFPSEDDTPLRNWELALQFSEYNWAALNDYSADVPVRAAMMITSK